MKVSPMNLLSASLACAVVSIITAIPASAAYEIGWDDFDSPGNYLSRINSSPIHTSGAVWEVIDRSSVLYNGFPDTSLFAVNGGPGDGTDVLGILKSTKTDKVFGMYRGGLNGARTLTYTFDVEGFDGLRLSMDWAACGDLPTPGIKVTASIDGGAEETIFEIGHSSTSPVYVMEDGRIITSYARRALVIANGVQVGELTNAFQPFVGSIAGSGSVLTVTISMTSTGAGRPYAFDNLVLSALTGLNELDALETVSGGYPHYFRFQESTWFAERLKFEFDRGDRTKEASYQLWKEAFSPYQGMLASRFERDPSISFVKEFADRFKQDFPNKMVLWQTSGNSWYFQDQGTQWAYYHPAHFLYNRGSVASAAVDADDEIIGFPTLPAGVNASNSETNYYVVLVDRDSGGNLDWSRTEHARVTGVSGTSLQIKRGVFPEYPARDFTEPPYIATHTQVRGYWLFNFSTEAPVDPVSGWQGWEARARHLASLFARGTVPGGSDAGELWRTDGLQFDAVTTLDRAIWRDADSNVDGVRDQGVLTVQGITRDTYSEGLVRKFELLRAKLSDENYVDHEKLINSDPVQYAREFIHGVEKEAQGTDLDYSVINLMAFMHTHSGAMPMFNYFNQKFVDWKTRQDRYRLNLGMATVLEAKFTRPGAGRDAFPVMDDVMDEITQGNQLTTGWLGQPAGPLLNFGLDVGGDELSGLFDPPTSASLAHLTSTSGGLDIGTGYLRFEPEANGRIHKRHTFYVLRVPVSAERRIQGEIDLRAVLPPEIAGFSRFGSVSLQSFVALAPSAYQYESDPISEQPPGQWFATSESVDGDPVEGWNIFARKNRTNWYRGAVYNVAANQKLLVHFKGYDQGTFSYMPVTLRVIIDGNTTTPALSVVIPASSEGVIQAFEVDLQAYAGQDIDVRVEVVRGNDSGGSRSYSWLGLSRLVFSDMAPNFVHRKMIVEDDEVTGEPVTEFKEESTDIYATDTGSFSNGFVFSDIDPAIDLVHVRVDIDYAEAYDVSRIRTNHEFVAFAREFDHGYVLVNNSGADGPDLTFDLVDLFGVSQAQKLQRRVDRAPEWQHDDLSNDGSTVGPHVTVPSGDALFLMKIPD